MTEEQQPSSTKDDIVARHRAMVDAFEGRRPMDWSIWDMFIDDSTCLTQDGQSVAHWAVNTLQHALGDNFLQRVKASMMIQQVPDGLEPSLHPILSFGFWPANDVPWVYANLIQLAAQIHLFNRNLSTNRFGKVLKSLQENLQSINWVSALLQIEVASLGLRAEWDIKFEPSLGNTHSADICLIHDSVQLLVETTSMRMSDAERKALAFYQRFGWQLTHLEWQYGVRISGFLGWSRIEEEMKQWLQDIEGVAQITGQDGTTRLVKGPQEGLLNIFRPTAATVNESWGITYPTVEARILERLVARLQDKQKQVEGCATPVWVRLDEYAGLWQATRFQGMTLKELLTVLVPFLQQKLTVYPDLAGVILAPAVLWNGGVPSEKQRMQIERIGGRAVRSLLPGNRLRETIVVSRIGLSQAEKDAQLLADWYTHEDTWLDWALQQIQFPPFDALVQE